MTSKQLKGLCEQMGFGIAHARTNNRTGVVTAYVAVRHPDHGDVDELRWSPADPGNLDAYQHATKRNGWTQYDKFVGKFTVADLIS